MTRRAFLCSAFGVAVTATPASGAGVHVTGTLRDGATDGQDGYFALCGTTACAAKDALAIVVHPQSPVCHSLRAMVGREVQVSVFSV